MPSSDNFTDRKDEALRKELGLSDQERPRETAPTAAEKRQRDMNPQVMRIASRLGVPADVLAARIPADTMRRLKYPVLETVDDEGRHAFKHDPGIVETRRASVRS